MTQTMNLTDREIESQWDAGNNAGDGYAVGDEQMSPYEAAEAEGFSDIRTFATRQSTGHCVIGRDATGDWVAVCDANGPWAVTLSAE